MKDEVPEAKFGSIVPDHKPGPEASHVTRQRREGKSCTFTAHLLLSYTEITKAVSNIQNSKPCSLAVINGAVTPQTLQLGKDFSHRQTPVTATKAKTVKSNGSGRRFYP